MNKILKIASYALLVLTILYGYTIYKASNKDVDLTKNMQKPIQTGKQIAINTKAYTRDNQFVVDFYVKNSAQKQENSTNDGRPKTAIEHYKQELSYINEDISSPIYYEAGTTNVDVANSTNGTVSSEFNEKNVNKLTSGYIKQGENLLFDIPKIDKENRFYVAIYPEDVDQESVGTNTKPVMVITYDIEKVPEYLDMSTFLNNFETIKKDSKENEKYSKWIYFNELNPNIISTFIDSKVANIIPDFDKYKDYANSKNALNYIEPILQSNIKWEQKWLQNSYYVHLVTGSDLIYFAQSHKELSGIQYQNLYYNQLDLYQKDLTQKAELRESYEKNSTLEFGGISQELLDKYKEDYHKLNQFEKVAFINSMIAATYNYSGTENINAPYWNESRPS